MAVAQSTGLYRYYGDGEARCVDCVLETMDANLGMRQSDWEDDQYGETSCDICDATIVKAVR